MAGVKVTDLTTLGSASPTDIMYIVDAAADQSKKIEVQNIYDGMPQFSSGSFSMVISGENDCSIGDAGAFYSRVGDVVTCSLLFEVTAINGATTISFNVDPPVPSTFSTAKDCFGICNVFGQSTTLIQSFFIIPDLTYNKITIQIQGDGTPDFNIQYVTAMIQYKVI